MIFVNEGNAYEDFLDVQELDNFIKKFDTLKKAEILDFASQLDVSGLNYLIYELKNLQMKNLFITAFQVIPLDAFLWLEYNAKIKLITVLGDSMIINIFIALEASDIVLFIEDLDDFIKDRLLSIMPNMVCEAVLKRMKYPEDTAGRAMKSNFIIIYDYSTVDEALNTVKNINKRFRYQLIAVVNHTRQFKGTIPLRDLLIANTNKKVKDLNLIEHQLDVKDRLDIAVVLFKSHGISAIPVISEEAIVGVISIQHMVNFIQDENEEDIMSISGVTVSSASTNVISGVYSRLPSLILNLLMAFMISFLTSRFDVLLKYHETIAYLLNVIPSLAGALAVQTMSMTIQSITKGFINNKNYNRFILKEVIIALLVALIIMLIGSILAFILFNDIYITICFGASVFIALLCTGFVGASIPILLEYIGLDSSVSSGAIITSLTDVFGYFIFLVFTYNFLF